ncbi:hypothetical protein E4T39_01504 [Aureobasidium subglaciale]|nr:hypothetical protein E4T39_01504 [Aureobasidium subglaciale]
MPFPLDPPQEENIPCSSQTFHLIQIGEPCASIAKDYDIPQEDVFDSYTALYASCDQFRAGLKMCIPEKSFCLSEVYHTTEEGDTCASIAKTYGVASYALATGNEGKINDCNSIQSGLTLCMPLTCDLYELQDGDTCYDLEIILDIPSSRSLQQYNPWINNDCSNLDLGRVNYGGIVCTSPQGGESIPPRDRTSSEAQIASSTASMATMIRSFFPKTTTAVFMDGHTRPTGSAGDVAKTSSGPSGVKLAAETAGVSVNTSLASSADNVSAATMTSANNWQFAVLAFAATMLSYAQ